MERIFSSFLKRISFPKFVFKSLLFSNYSGFSFQKMQLIIFIKIITNNEINLILYGTWCLGLRITDLWLWYIHIEE